MTTYNERHYYRREPTIGELVSDLSTKASTLVQQEMQLAKVEMKEKAVQAGRELTLIAIGGLLGNAALLATTAALIMILALWMPLWVAVLMVGIVFAIAAALMIGAGIQALKNLNPVPTKTIDSLQENKEWLAAQIN